VFAVIGRNTVGVTGVRKVVSFATPVALADPYCCWMEGKVR